MKKILLAIAILCSLASAQPDADAYQWPRSYFASIGFNVIANRGDLFKRSVRIQSEDGTTETINFPQTKVLMSPDYVIGVNIREFSVAASFQYWSMTGEINGIPEDLKEQDIRFWRLGVELTYNFFYPELFQAGLGLGYSFSALKANKSAMSEKGLANSELMGSAIALIGNVRYYITDYFCLNPALRIYENWYKAVNTKNSGTVEFHDNDISYVWQTYIAISISAMVQF